VCNYHKSDVNVGFGRVVGVDKVMIGHFVWKVIRSMMVCVVIGGEGEMVDKLAAGLGSETGYVCCGLRRCWIE